MKLNVAVQMDPIARINIRGDSTFALLLEAQKRGHGLPPPLYLLLNSFLLHRRRLELARRPAQPLAKHSSTAGWLHPQPICLRLTSCG